MVSMRILASVVLLAASTAAGSLWAADDQVAANAGGAGAAGTGAGAAAAAKTPAGHGKGAKSGPSKPVVAAKQLFGAVKTPAPLAARAIGYYSRGCLAGAQPLPIDGPAWQAMRLSRHRNWGHPELIKLVEKLAVDARAKDGWPGLLVGDIAQARGGPMLTGHASHQVGLDADIWLTPMPNRRLSEKEREDLSATSMLAVDDISVNPKVWRPGHVALIKRAASYHEVERILVHPAIKKALCEAAGSDRAWLGKVRPYWGHYYHFHMRIACPKGSSHCKPQAPPTGEDGCGKELATWIRRVTPHPPAPPPPPGTKPPPRKPPPPPMTLERLPAECREVLTSGSPGIPKPLLAKALEAAEPHKADKAGAHKASGKASGVKSAEQR